MTIPEMAILFLLGYIATMLTFAVKELIKLNSSNRSKDIKHKEK